MVYGNRFQQVFRVVLVAFVACFAGLVVAGSTQVAEAEASDTLTVQGDFASPTYESQPNTYYEDFGTLYRMGNIWYDKETNEARYYLRSDGHAYPEGVSPGVVNCLYHYVYSDGFVSYQAQRFEDVRRIGSGFPHKGSTSASKDSLWDGTPTGFRGYLYAAPNNTEEERGLVRVVSFDESLEGFSVVDSSTGTKSKAINLLSAHDWFAGCYNLRTVTGWKYVRSPWLRDMTGMFKGCTSLRSLDLSPLDTRTCRDFEDMFAGCSSLDTLVLGENWSQSQVTPGATVTIGVGGATSTKKAAKATFPVDMVCSTAEGDVTYHAGDVIPDGAGVYRAIRTDITAGTVRIVRPNSFVIDRAQYKKYKAGTLSRPEGVSEKNVLIYEDVMAQGGNSKLMCEYTSAAVEPIVLAEVDGKRLVEGVDFDVTYRSNVAKGEASVMVEGIGEYRGAVYLPFDIEDHGAYAFLVDGDTLVLKAGFDPPNSRKSYTGMRRMLWFNTDTDVPGASIPWSAYKNDISTVIIDASFSELEPMTCKGWFDGCKKLQEVTGLANLNLISAVSMANMFRGCTSLELLDVTGLSTGNASDMSGFIDGCKALKTFTTGTGWSISAASAAGKTPALPLGCYRMKPTPCPYEAGDAIPSGAAEYRFGDIPMQFVSKVVMKSDTYACTGKPVEPKLTILMGDVKLEEGRDYEVGYANNLYPGKARAIILGKGQFSGGLIVPFTLKARVTKVGDRLTYKTKNATYVLTVTKVKKQNGTVVAVSTAITSITVQSSTIKSLTLPNECTIGGVKVTVTSVGSKLTGKFRNVSCVIVGSKVTTIGAKAFAKAPKVKKLKVKSKRLTNVKNCLKGSNVTQVVTNVKLSNAKRLKYQKWFLKMSGKKGVRFVYLIV